uniref:Chemokine interleukin-8-like domain-containing protein n=1 Tax=Nothobranchius furzeri TaxID=105023 RepID=A0A8C6VU27_NOTFU
MSAIIKVLLLLAVLAYISKAQINEPGQNCLCQRVRNGTISRTKIKDVQIYHATVFCSKSTSKPTGVFSTTSSKPSTHV